MNTEPRWIDAHAHLYDIEPVRLDDAMVLARAAGVIAVINAGTSLATSRTVAGQCARFPGEMFGTAGVSPFDAANLPASWIDDLTALAGLSGIVGIGEIGLDASNSRYPDVETQMPVFERQLELACSRDLPVVVHSRGAERRVVDVCRAFSIRKAVFHCFTGDAQVLPAILDAGYYVSFSGIVTFRNAAAAQLIPQVPLDRLLIETDTPYLTPEPHRGEPNQPAWVAVTAAAVARLRRVSRELLSQALMANFCRVFGVDLTGAV